MERTVIWGIDPGTNRVAAAIVGASDNHHELISANIAAADDWPSKLATMQTQIATASRAWVASFGFPALIALERPAAHGHPNVKLIQAYGVIMAALATTVAPLAGETIWLEAGASQWKKATLDDGTADTLEYCRRLRELGIPFDNADEAAAYWIATWAKSKIAP